MAPSARHIQLKILIGGVGGCRDQVFLKDRLATEVKRPAFESFLVVDQHRWRLSELRCRS